MLATEAITKIRESVDLGVTAMASRLNIAQNTLSSRLAQDNLSFAKAVEMLRILDYKIVFMPRESPTPKDGIVVDDKREQKKDSEKK